MLELFTGGDRYDALEHRRAGVLTEEQLECVAVNGRDPCEIDLPLPTFTATAEMAGISRVMGGYHIQADNIEGLKLGRRVAEYSWPKMQAYFDGTAKVTR
jgi:hypothetical protein